MLTTIAITRRPLHACLLDLVREHQPAARRALLRELDGRVPAEFGLHDSEAAPIEAEAHTSASPR